MTYTHSQDLSLLLLGTGTSSSLPSIGCLTNPISGCWCCRSTLLKDDPKYEKEYKKNERRNISGMVRIPYEDDKRRKERTILIDCGKSFFSGAVEWWPKKNLREIDAVLLTHAHADAILGLDDLRGWTLRGHIQESIPIYCTQETFDGVSKAFPYLTNMGQATGGGDIPALTWHIIEPHSPFSLFGIEILPLSVEHGKFFTTPPKPFLCTGFLINRQICYLSDVSKVPEEVYELLEDYVEVPTTSSGSRTTAKKTRAGKVEDKGKEGTIGNGNSLERGIETISLSHSSNPPPEEKIRKPSLQVLIVDCLRLEEFTSHFGLGQAIETIERLGAKKNYLIGFGHRTSHTSWLKACKLLSTPSSTSGYDSLSIDKPTFNDLYNGHPDPLKEDGEVFAKRAMQIAENYSSREGGGVGWEKGGKERRWVRPSCDGMTIRVGKEKEEVGDDEYDQEVEKGEEE